MPKDTKTLGNNKARACESLGFVHKKGCARVLTQPHFFYSNRFIFKIDPRKTKKEHINSFSALIKRTNDKTQKRPLTIKIESDR